MDAIERFASMLSPGDVVLDIGANVGTYAAKFSHRVGADGRVIAVEPDPDTYSKLVAACWPMGNVACVRACVGSSEGTSILYRDKGDSRRNSRYRENVVDASRLDPQTVPMRTLDSLSDGVTAIKIDAQGSEMDILRGGMGTLARRGLTWCVEIWPVGLVNAGASVRDIADCFALHGYHPISMTWDEACAMSVKMRTHSSFDVVLVSVD